MIAMGAGKETYVIGSDNCQLQAYIHHKPGSSYAGSRKLGIVIFHPYPHLGGCFDDPSVLSIYRSAVASSHVQTVVRYNQRGTGSSSGSKSVWGNADMADAKAVCNHVLSLPDGPDYLHVIGYSWGACLAAEAAQLENVKAYIGISPVTGKLASVLLRTKRYISKLASRSELPKLFVLGDHDQFSSTASLEQAVHTLHEQAANSHRSHNESGNQALASSTVIKVMCGCDHFFVNQRRELALCVLQFCLDHQC